METFFSFLEKRVDDCSSLLCVGLDPHVSDLAHPTAASVRDFCLNLVKQTAPYAAAFKPNAAFFEVFGADGWVALKHVIEAIKEESARRGSMIPIILDAKRGDIASTADAYAQSAFESLGADCITLSPYLGKDSVEPFLVNSEKGVFLLCKTSNAGSMDLQNLLVMPMGSDSPMPLYIYVAKLAEQWNEKNNVGIVVGATHPQIMEMIRAAAPGLACRLVSRKARRRRHDHLGRGDGPDGGLAFHPVVARRHDASHRVGQAQCRHHWNAIPQRAGSPP